MANDLKWVEKHFGLISHAETSAMPFRVVIILSIKKESEEYCVSNPINTLYGFSMDFGDDFYSLWVPLGTRCACIWKLAHLYPLVYNMLLHELWIHQQNINDFNSSPRGQNGRHFADDIFRCIFLYVNFIFWLKCHWSLFLKVQLTIIRHWFS